MPPNLVVLSAVSLRLYGDSTGGSVVPCFSYLKLDVMRIMRIIEGMRFKEIEKRLLADGWVLKSQRGSHRQYVHPVKPGKVTLPNHTGDLDPRTVKSRWKQAGINERRTK